MTMDDKVSQVQNIPFPAITFFGEFKFSDNYAKRLYSNFFRMDKKTENYLFENDLMLE